MIGFVDNSVAINSLSRSCTVWLKIIGIGYTNQSIAIFVFTTKLPNSVFFSLPHCCHVISAGSVKPKTVLIQANKVRQQFILGLLKFYDFHENLLLQIMKFINNCL